MDSNKAWGLWRMRATAALSVFRLYGMDVYIPETIIELEKLVHQLQDDLNNA